MRNKYNVFVEVRRHDSDDLPYQYAFTVRANSYCDAIRRASSMNDMINVGYKCFECEGEGN